MEFNNPIGQQSIGNFSIQQPVVDNTGSMIANGVASLLDFMQPRAVDRGALVDQEKTAGSQLAVERVKRFKDLEKVEGRGAAVKWLSKQYLEDQSAGTDTFSDTYRSVITENLGSSFIALEEARAREQEDTQVQLIQGYINKGAELLAGQGADPALFSDEQMMLMGQRYDGKNLIVSQATAEAALDTARFSANVRDRNIKSNAVFSDFMFEEETQIRSALASVSRLIESNPNSELQVRTEALERVRMQQATLRNRLTQQIVSAGGDITDVENKLSQVENMYNAYTDLVSGKLGIQASKDMLDKMSLDATMDYFKSPASGDRMSKAMLIQNSLRFPVEGLGSVSTGTSTPEVMKQASLQASNGIGKVAKSYSLSPTDTKQLYTNLVMVADGMARVDDQESKRSAGVAVVNNLLEATYSPVSQLKTVLSPNGLPTMFGELAKIKPNPDLGAAIQEAAIEEGVEPIELWVQSAEQMFRTQILPSLRVEDPQYTQNLKVDFSGGKFNVTYNSNLYRGMDARRGSLTGGSALRVPSAVSRGNADAKKAAQIQKLLNDMAVSYAKVMGTSTDEVGPAIKAQLDFAMGIVNE